MAKSRSRPRSSSSWRSQAIVARVSGRTTPLGAHLGPGDGALDHDQVRVAGRLVEDIDVGVGAEQGGRGGEAERVGARRSAARGRGGGGPAAQPVELGRRLGRRLRDGRRRGAPRRRPGGGFVLAAAGGQRQRQRQRQHRAGERPQRRRRQSHVPDRTASPSSDGGSRRGVPLATLGRTRAGASEVHARAPALHAHPSRCAVDRRPGERRLRVRRRGRARPLGVLPGGARRRDGGGRRGRRDGGAAGPPTRPCRPTPPPCKPRTSTNACWT